MSSVTVGIDVASQPGNTGACTIVWGAREARVTDLEIGLDDDRLVDFLAAEGPDRVGVDVPLGWPSAFVDALARHHRGEPWGDLEDPPKAKTLTHRATDRWVHEQPDLRLWPLSVSTDRIAYSAMRMARLLGRLGRVDRSGEGRIVEVYPAAALKSWGLDPRGYMGSSGEVARLRLVRELRQSAPWLEAEEYVWERLRGDDNLFDAVICAIVARAAARGLCRDIPREHRAVAEVEGWIHVPQQGSLQQLGPTR